MTMFLKCLLVALVAAGAAARTANTDESKVQRAFEQYGLVPNPIKVAPKYQLYVKQANGAMANLGNELKVWEVQDKSVVTYPADSNSFYAIIFFDADSDEDSDDDCTQYLHFLVVNVPGNHADKGRVIVEYEGPQLERGSGFHRYVGIVYKQTGKIKENNWSGYADRDSFSLNDFVEKYCLDNPVAGNFFKARGEESC